MRGLTLKWFNRLNGCGEAAAMLLSGTWTNYALTRPKEMYASKLAQGVHPLQSVSDSDVVSCCECRKLHALESADF